MIYAKACERPLPVKVWDTNGAHCRRVQQAHPRVQAGGWPRPVLPSAPPTSFSAGCAAVRLRGVTSCPSLSSSASALPHGLAVVDQHLFPASSSWFSFRFHPPQEIPRASGRGGTPPEVEQTACCPDWGPGGGSHGLLRTSLTQTPAGAGSRGSTAHRTRVWEAARRPASETPAFSGRSAPVKIKLAGL